MKNSLSKITTCFLLTLIFSCINETKEVKQEITEKRLKVNSIEENKNLNISFLLDLSDRINPNKYPNKSMEFYLRDVAYIKSVSNAFASHLNSKKVRQMNDRIQLYFDPEPQNQNINSISDDLRYNITRSNVSIETLNQIKKAYSDKPREIYELAIKDNEFVGSNTWGFFKTKVKDYCIEDNYRNILVILTDGYIYHEDTKQREENLTSYLTPQEIRKFKLNNKNWKDRLQKNKYGFLPTNNDLSNLEILVLGINPDKKNDYELDVILKYWRDWFNNMNVKRYKIKTTALPSNMNDLITDFILGE